MENKEQQTKKLTDLFAASGIYLEFDSKNKRFFLDKYLINYSSKLSALQTLEEVFVNMAYNFITDEESPFIIDAGSEVGIATLFFKILYPKAKILCFEAHPYAFKLLQQNIKDNKLEDIQAVNSALSDTEGTINFFGEFDFVADDLDTRGSSTVEAWGLQRETSKTISVKATKISNYLKDDRISYLKLNIEGAEQQVLDNLDQTKKMDLIDRILIKFHYSSKTKSINDLDHSLRILSNNNFIIKDKIKKNIAQIFPSKTRAWAEENEVSLYTFFVEKANCRKVVKHHNNHHDLRNKLNAQRISMLKKEVFLLKSVIDNVPSSIYWKDRNGYYLGSSAYAIDKLHETNIAPEVTLKNIVGKSDYDLFDQKVADKYRKNDLYIMENNQHLVLEENIITPDGKELVQLSSKQPLYDEKMDVIGIIGSTVDITDRKKNENLMQEKKLSEKTAEILEILSGAIAHEIKTPLSSININLDQLRLSEQEAQNKLVDNMKLAINKADNIIEMLLLKLRTILSNTVPTTDTKKYLIKNSINAALNEYPFDVDEKSVLIKWEQNSYDDFYYTGNNFFIKHVIFNLIKNSLNAIKNAGRGEICISLNSQDKNFNQLIFLDTALGIDNSQLDEIFKPFTSYSQNGSGLGLAFCKLIMESYKGNITCDSVLGEYTKFTLWFPKIS